MEFRVTTNFYDEQVDVTYTCGEVVEMLAKEAEAINKRARAKFPDLGDFLARVADKVVEEAEEETEEG